MQEVSDSLIDGASADTREVAEYLLAKGVRSAVGKFSKERLMDAAKEFNLVTEEDVEEEIRSTDAATRIHGLLTSLPGVEEEEGYTTSTSGPTAAEFAEEKAEKPRYGVRCPRRGHLAITFPRGFNPRQPFNSAGQRIPFKGWPMKFHGPEGMDPLELEHWSREHPTCPYCKTRIPLRNSGRDLLARVVVKVED